MEFTPRAAELTTLLENRIINYYTDLKVDEIGRIVIERVVSVGDGIARVYGLNEIQAGEMVEFASGVKGIALNWVELNFFLDYHILSVLAYLSMFGFLIQAFILIAKMDKPHIPDLNLTIPGSSDPGNSGEDDREREKKIRRCRGLVKKWVGNYCRQVCLGRGVCRPKCISQMSTEEQESLISQIWTGFHFDVNPSLRRIDYVWRKARDLTPSEVENHPITRAWKGQWDWDDL